MFETEIKNVTISVDDMGRHSLGGLAVGALDELEDPGRGEVNIFITGKIVGNVNDDHGNLETLVENLQDFSKWLRNRSTERSAVINVYLSDGDD